jgi:hypothetical protein
MANRNLSELELKKAKTILDKVRKDIKKYSGGDKELEFAFTRKVYKELIYDERGKPSIRRKLKQKMREMQNNLCAICKQTLSEKYVVLDRKKASGGYTPENTKLICVDCDKKIQLARGYR